MSNWKQVGGDMSWEGYGVVLAKDEPAHRQVHVVRIEPWIQHDREATLTHGLYLVDEKTVDYEELTHDTPELRSALRSVGMESEEYRKLPPEHQVEVLASYGGYDDSRSVNKLAEALPAPPHQIDFWAGAETTEKLAAYDREMRRAALKANFVTRLPFGGLPSPEALEFALGDDSFDMELDRRDALAFEYAMAAARASGATHTATEFAQTIGALVAAPSPDQLDPTTSDPRLEVLIETWRCRYGDPADDEQGITATSQALAARFMEAIGFDWT